MNLSPRQFKILKQLKIMFPYEEYGLSDKKIIDELCDFGLLENNNGFISRTEKGKAVLYDRYVQAFKFWIPNILSIIAIVISIIALKKSL